MYRGRNLSEQEGFGIVLLEAMACGRPVISTEIVGVAILEILKDEELAEEMGRQGRRLVEEKYTWKKIGGKMLGIYEELV